MDGLKLNDYFYELPKELIAQKPLVDRSSSRLMKFVRLNSLLLNLDFSIRLELS